MKLGATALREVEMQKFASAWREVGGLLRDSPPYHSIQSKWHGRRSAQVVNNRLRPQTDRDFQSEDIECSNH